jgi:hypothetical protein
VSDDTATKVAAALRDAFTAGPEAAQTTLRSLYGDAVDYRHNPPMPSDGVVVGERLCEASGREAAAINSAIPGFRYEGLEVTIGDDDRVHVKVWIVGTLGNGTEVRVPSNMYCTVRDGHIVGMEHMMDADAMAAWADVATAAGLQVGKDKS